jgi:hypothetical protein
MNLIIDDTDHPLIIKVATIVGTRIQVYFIDNEDYFTKRKMEQDENGNDYADNGERAIFFARGVLETVKKLRWVPDIIHVQGWMSAVVPLYIKTAYREEPSFANTKVVTSLFPKTITADFGENFKKCVEFREADAKLLEKYNDTFDFDEFPIAGQPYQGYFVVASDPIHRTATLLHDTRVSYTAPANNSTLVSWQAAINAAMNSLTTPAFAGANAQWRLPTEAECQVFAKNTDYVMSFSPTNGYGYFYFYQNDATLKWGGYQDTGSALNYVNGNTFIPGIVLQPVIDITY